MRWLRNYCIILLTLAIWCSCRSVEYVPIETVKVEYKERIVKDSSATKEVTNVRDSVIYRDSVVNVVDENGNLLRTEVYKWKERFRESNYLLKQLQAKYDSLYAAKQDSVMVPYPVERSLSRWQRAKLELGGWAFGGIILMVIIIVGWLVYQKRKR